MLKITANSSGARARLQIRINSLEPNADRALKTTAHFLEGKMTEKISLDQLAPPLSPETIRKKGSSRILFDKGALLGQITATFPGPMVAEVGVLDSGDKKRAFIARVHEYGSPSRNIPERSFMRSSWVENRGKMLKVFSKAMGNK
jgi:hypothetical protein